MKTNVYDPDAFQARVNYAATCLIRGTASRRRDTCFEMNDGDAVVVALSRRAARNPRLAEAIRRGWSEMVEGLPASWHAKFIEHKDVATRDLPKLAARMRARVSTLNP